MQQRFLLQILLLAQHVSGTTDQAIHYKKTTKNTHTRPPRHSTHLVTNLDNTRHLRLRTLLLLLLLLLLYRLTSVLPDFRAKERC